MIVGDTSAMREGAAQIDAFAKNLEATCQNALQIINRSEGAMPFSEGQTALQLLKNYVTNILNALPEANSVQKQLTDRADDFDEGLGYLRSL